MHLSNAEFAEMRVRFHSTSVCDEQYRGPFDVDAGTGGAPWRVYVEGSRFREACDWVKRRRAEAVTPAIPPPASRGAE